MNNYIHCLTYSSHCRVLSFAFHLHFSLYLLFNTSVLWDRDEMIQLNRCSTLHIANVDKCMQMNGTCYVSYAIKIIMIRSTKAPLQIVQMYILSIVIIYGGIYIVFI